MKKTQHYVGLDVHKDTIMIAVADGGREGEVRLYGQVSGDLHAVERALRKIGADGGELTAVHVPEAVDEARRGEASPCIADAIVFVLRARLRRVGAASRRPPVANALANPWRGFVRRRAIVFSTLPSNHLNSFPHTSPNHAPTQTSHTRRHFARLRHRPRSACLCAKSTVDGEQQQLQLV